MIYSMTAYTSHELKGTWGNLYWEIRALNHRYLDLSFKLPEEFRSIENELREIAKKHVNRGKLDCNLKLEINSNLINLDAVDHIIAACKQIESKMQSYAKISPIDILSMPAVMQAKQANQNKFGIHIEQAFKKAILKLKAARKREGKELAKIIIKRLDNMSSQTKKIQNKLPKVLNNQRIQIINRLKETTVNYDCNRLEQELVYLAQKMDIAEELDRLYIHIKEAKRMLTQGGLVGKKLDFLLQEMNREVNTLASKSADSQISLITVELKVLIEQIREQVQNLE